MEIVKTKKLEPPRILVHAGHGLGKSSLAAAAPRPLFIQTEEGLANIDTEALPFCRDFETMMNQLSQVYQQEHDFRTLVIDSLDWTEILINQHVCKEHDKKSISDFGYGKGFQMAVEQFGRVIRALKDIRDKRNMAIILTAHSNVEIYNNPMGEDYDVYQIKLRDKNAQLFTEWVDLIGFLHFQVYTTKEKDGFKEQVKATGGTERVLSVTPNAAYVSKNRYGITEDISFPDPVTGWNNLYYTITGGY